MESTWGGAWAKKNSPGGEPGGPPWRKKTQDIHTKEKKKKKPNASKKEERGKYLVKRKGNHERINNGEMGKNWRGEQKGSRRQGAERQKPQGGPPKNSAKSRIERKLQSTRRGNPKKIEIQKNRGQNWELDERREGPDGEKKEKKREEVQLLKKKRTAKRKLETRTRKMTFDKWVVVRQRRAEHAVRWWGYKQVPHKNARGGGERQRRKSGVCSG